MEKNFAVVTIFALLFAVTTARISLIDPTQPLNGVGSDSNIVLPTEQTKENYDVPNKKQPEENDQTFKVDLTAPRSEFARFHAINRHFFDRPRNSHRYIHSRPYTHFGIPKPKTSCEKNNAGHQRLQGPLKRMKLKNQQRHHNHHQHQRHRYHHHIHRDTNDMFNMKHKFDHVDKVKRAGVVHQQQHKEIKTQHEAGFMRNIRKFLKHSFE